MRQAQRWVIVPAAGTGSRFGGDVPKQYARLLDQSVLEHTLRCMLQYADPAGVLVAISADDPYWEQLDVARDPRITTVAGGRERADSVQNGLAALVGRAQAEDWVLVHDAARPCIEQQDVENLIGELEGHPVGGLLAVPVADTLKRAASNGSVETTVDRNHLWQAQTPQMFRYQALSQAMEAACQQGLPVTDEASAMEYAGFLPRLVAGSRTNLKITNREDLMLARLICGAEAGRERT